MLEKGVFFTVSVGLFHLLFCAIYPTRFDVFSFVLTREINCLCQNPETIIRRYIKYMASIFVTIRYIDTGLRVLEWPQPRAESQSNSHGPQIQGPVPIQIDQKAEAAITCFNCLHNLTLSFTQ